MARLPFRVVVVTDRAACAARGRGVLETTVRALEGLDAPPVAFLHRDKERTAEENLRSVAALRTLCLRFRVPVLVHTQVFVATSLGLLGAHLSSEALSTEGEVALARSLLKEGALLGASAHAGDVLPELLDYAFLSPVFRPSSKPDDPRPTLGLPGLRSACAASAVPLVALGGIDDTNARACLDAGAQAVAVLGQVMGALDPKAALRRLLDALS